MVVKAGEGEQEEQDSADRSREVPMRWRQAVTLQPVQQRDAERGGCHPSKAIVLVPSKRVQRLLAVEHVLCVRINVLLIHLHLVDHGEAEVRVPYTTSNAGTSEVSDKPGSAE